MFRFVSCLGLSVLAVLVLVAGTAQGEVSFFDWAYVGDVGNLDDDTGYGGVEYGYWISKHYVTNTQYSEFLNAVAATDTNGLYHSGMTSHTRGGIIRDGSPGSYTYSVKDPVVGIMPGGADYTFENKPVTYVSWNDAVRFANWMENGQPSGAQVATTTEDGAYDMSLPFPVRKPGAKVFLTSEDEWYKAAYYDPNHGGLGVGGYWDYATGTDARPDNNYPTDDTGNSVNYYDGSYTTGTPNYPNTDVGAYTLSASPYGTFDQNGQNWEWTEGDLWGDRVQRVFRGGSYLGGWPHLVASFREGQVPEFQDSHTGFRVASVPEPSTLILLAMGAVGLAAWAWRRRRRA